MLFNTETTANCAVFESAFVLIRQASDLSPGR